MAELLQIEEPTPPRRAPPTWQAFLELGFRPLYLLGCVWGIVGVALWVYAPGTITGQMPGVIWHAHEMLWGFVVTVAVGFLLTAASNWTGVNPLHGPALGAACVFWLLARMGFLLPGGVAFGLAAVGELLFQLIATVAVARAIYGRRSQRNYGVPVLMAGLMLTNALYLWAAWQGDYELLMQRFNTGLVCMAVVALLIGRRVIPFFASRAVAGLSLPDHSTSGQWQLGVGGLAVLFSLLHWTTPQAIALALAGLLAVWQLVAWRPQAVRKVPLLWVLYAGYGGLALGLLLAAVQLTGVVARAAWPTHLIGVGGFAMLIIGMVTRTAMGHTGRPLKADRSMVISYLLVLLATVLRLAALLPTAAVLPLLHSSAAAWVCAFGLYLWRFVPWLIRPRADARGGTPVSVSLSRSPKKQNTPR
jgi:uncharacterized protein involved in response to NO